MKITQKTESELDAKEGNLIGIFIGGISIIAGGGFMYVNGFHNGDQWFVSVLPIIFIVIGVLTILFASSTFITINKMTGQISYRKKSLVKDTVTTYATGDALHVEMRKTWKTEQTGSSEQGNLRRQQVLISQGVLVFKDGSELLLSQQRSANTSTAAIMINGVANVEHGFASEAASFLGIEFKVLTPSGGALGLGIDVGGIQL
jgi:hypothetical protein